MKNCAAEFLFLRLERAEFLLSVGNKVLPAGEHLPDGAGLRRYVLDAVNDPVFLVAENEIAVLSHKLQNQILSAQISQLIVMLDLKMDNPFQIRLPDPDDFSAADMFPKKHTEIRSRHGRRFIF